MTSRPYDPNHPSFTAALDELRAEIEAIPRDQIEPVRLDIALAIVATLGVLERVVSFREQVASEIGESAAAHFDRLESSANACGRAHALYLTSVHADLEEVADALSQTRRVLSLEADTLVAKKLLRASALGGLAGGNGYKPLYMDVLQIVSALRAEWTAIESHTPVTSLELDQAEAAANKLAKALGESEQGPSSSPSGELRGRAYTFFVRTYEECRRAITFVRWQEGDVDEIIPSLFAGRTRQSKDDADDDDDVIAPVVSPTDGPPTSGVPIRPGLPGAPPFVTS